MPSSGGFHKSNGVNKSLKKNRLLDRKVFDENRLNPPVSLILVLKAEADEPEGLRPS